MSDYGREDVLRIFGIREQQLRLWERNGLIASAQAYSFQELGQIRKLRELGTRRIPVTRIRDAVMAMRAVSGLRDPLLEAGVEAGSPGAGRLTFRYCGAVMEPIAGQYLLDFSGTGACRLAVVATPVVTLRERDREVTLQFTRGVLAEEGGRLDEAVAGYEAVLALEPKHAPSAINLGTICYHRREHTRAEQYYRMATESDPSYALAFFDLGNVLDELRRLPEAMDAYRRAIALRPTYADAHYNLALALERHGQRRTALRHWTAYLQLDGSGPWAVHARVQLRKTLGSLGLELVQGGVGRGARDVGRGAALRLV